MGYTSPTYRYDPSIPTVDWDYQPPNVEKLDPGHILEDDARADYGRALDAATERAAGELFTIEVWLPAPYGRQLVSSAKFAGVVVGGPRAGLSADGIAWGAPGLTPEIEAVWRGLFPELP